MSEITSFSKLIESLAKLPGIGPKSAQRIAFFVLKADNNYVQALADALTSVKQNVGFCERCFNISEGKLCNICDDPSRDNSLICVVEEPKDINPIERTKEFKGYYFVLGGSVNPSDGVGLEQLNFRQLYKRVEIEKPSEIMIATSHSTYGDLTASFLIKELKPLKVKMTRLATGLPAGAEIDSADEITLTYAINGRREIN